MNNDLLVELLDFSFEFESCTEGEKEFKEEFWMDQLRYYHKCIEEIITKELNKFPAEERDTIIDNVMYHVK